MKKAKCISESETVLSEVMMPVYANHYGSVHGGTIARKNVVLASMDHIVFKHPVNIGDMLNIRARLCHVGHSSMDIEVEIEAEKLKEGRVVKIGSAHLTMVALDERGRPAGVPKIILKTARERMKSRQAFARRKERLSRILH